MTNFLTGLTSSSIPGLGEYIVQVLFTPDDLVHYETASADTILTILGRPGDLLSGIFRGQGSTVLDESRHPLSQSAALAIAGTLH